MLTIAATGGFHLLLGDDADDRHSAHQIDHEGRHGVGDRHRAVHSHPHRSAGRKCHGAHGVATVVAADLRVDERPLIATHDEDSDQRPHDDASSDVGSLQPLAIDEPRHIHALQGDQ